MIYIIPKTAVEVARLKARYLCTRAGQENAPQTILRGYWKQISRAQHLLVGNAPD